MGGQSGNNSTHLKIIINARIRVATGYNCGEQSNLEEARKLCGTLEMFCGMPEMSGVCVKTHRSKHKMFFQVIPPQFQN